MRSGSRTGRRFCGWPAWGNAEVVGDAATLKTGADDAPEPRFNFLKSEVCTICHAREAS